jgi:hypothetical protein
VRYEKRPVVLASPGEAIQYRRAPRTTFIIDDV